MARAIEKGATYLDKLCHKLYDEPKGRGFRVDGKCCRCGGPLMTYYCEDRLHLIVCEKCGTLALTKAVAPQVAANLTLGQPTITQPPITGDTSDGYHTFNELYRHRAILFSVICNERPEVSWKSKRHHDGTMYDGMFIVGIDTPEGQATYHYDIDPYWDMFRVKELELAPEWDGHTPGEAIRRIGTLTTQNEWVSVDERLPTDEHPVLVFVGYADTMTGFITTSSYFCFDANPHWQWDGLVRDEQRTLFWMPLPEPPDRRPPEGEA